VLRELRRQGNLIEGDTVMVEVHPDVAQILAGPDHVYLEEIEKRLQKRIMVKARPSFELEDYELHSPGQKAIEHSESGSDRNESRRHKRRKKVGSPAEVQAMLDEEEQASLRMSGQDDEAADAAGAMDQVQSSAAEITAAAAVPDSGGIVVTPNGNGLEVIAPPPPAAADSPAPASPEISEPAPKAED
jgi:hypothetical protein